MGILDKLRPQSKSTHPDPNIRIEAIHELDPADIESLNAFAKDDTDARVRRVAVARIGDASVLADIVRNESEGSVRDHALGQLVEQASKHDASVAMTAVAALSSLGRERELATVAKAAGPDDVRRAAIAGVRDEKSLGSIARHGAEAGARLVALERLTEPAEIEGVALRGEHADSAVAAIDRLSNPSNETLTAIAEKARTKQAQKKARTLLKVSEPAAAPVDSGPAYKEADQQKARDMVAQMKTLASTSDFAQLREAYAAARVAWVELLADADIQSTIEADFENASNVVRERLAADEAARADAERQRRAMEQEQADRAAVCARVECLNGDDITDGVAQARAAWEGMPAMPEAWAAELERRFAEACRAAEKRFERRQLAKQSAERLPTLVPEVEALAENPSYNDIRSQWYSLRKQWQAIARDVDIDAGLRARYDAAAQKLEAQEQTHRDAKGAQQVENLHRLQALVQKFETRASAESLTLKQTDQLMKDVKLVVGTMGPLPTKQDREDLMVRLQAVRTSLTPRIQELREAEEWKRWANVQVQEELCVKMEALIPVAESDPEKASNEMRTLQERWKPVAAAPRSQAEALWTRFKTAQEQVYDKCKDFFALQATERVENLKKKEALCLRAESMADSTDWVKTADAMKTLQAEWKSVGAVTRGNEKAVWERFRAACDKFFTRRQDDLKQRKQDWSENLKRKEALVAEAKQLSESTEWEQAASRIKRLQVDWKTIGPVKKSKSDAIWNEFRGACDLFFERFKNRDSAALQGKMADRESAVNELEALLPAADATDAAAPDDLYAKVQAARARWVQGPDLPRHTLAPLAERVNAALFNLVTRWPDGFKGTDIDPELTKGKMEKLIAKVEKLLPTESAEPAKNLSPAELLARQWREALAANTMGAGASRQAEDARQRANEQEVRSAQAAWARLGPLAPDQRKPLQDRFDRAVRKFSEMRRRSAARA
ncbi:MAG TPA: DUF349 domain-containing protein [Vicinamibacterales bacterium]|nr:DUF349 domain-containing protein [Vicinamibacterales bacterium]